MGGGAITDGDAYSLISKLPLPQTTKFYSRKRERHTETLTPAAGVTTPIIDVTSQNDPVTALPATVAVDPVVYDGKTVKIRVKSLSVVHNQHLRNKLSGELELVRDLSRKVYSKFPDAIPAAIEEVAVLDSGGGEFANPNMPETENHENFINNGRFEVFIENPRPKFRHLSMSVEPEINYGDDNRNNGIFEGFNERPRQKYHQLSMSVAPEISRSMVEKRPPKANQHYQNSDFILTRKDRFLLPELTTTSINRKPLSDKRYVSSFKNCAMLLSRLMKHKFGWVFNSPVDAKGLGLHDYFIIVRYPMDLGTVKSRLNQNLYKSPDEFAEDVRLTFRNAMLYNPKGQDVHVMAEQLLQTFEEKWVKIEAEYTYYPIPSTPHTPSIRKPVGYVKPNPAPVNRAPVFKVVKQPKPKAKDLFKRAMTVEERWKLRDLLMELPEEKLEAAAMIIKKRNSALLQNGEPDLDVDLLDTETHWELDRFVSNYKKSLSKVKRRAEAAMTKKAKAEREREQQEKVHRERVMEQGAVEEPKEPRPVVGGKKLKFLNEHRVENNKESAGTSSSSGGSRSESGSSSSDSDSSSSS